ncbi:MAG: hypothetical protein HRU77_09710 [Gammaproteobacteria bacterium]|nr:MAG: hypothetical protein HRU77_09710 [Gammaproteobacteria bacterium]
MLLDHEKLNALILRIYDAALDDEQWSLLIRDLTRLFNAEDSILFGSPDIGNDRMLVLSPMINADINAPAAYESYFWNTIFGKPEQLSTDWHIGVLSFMAINS